MTVKLSPPTPDPGLSPLTPYPGPGPGRLSLASPRALGLLSLSPALTQPPRP